MQVKLRVQLQLCLFILHPVYRISCCLHADQILQKLTAPHKMPSNCIVRSTVSSASTGTITSLTHSLSLSSSNVLHVCLASLGGTSRAKVSTSITAVSFMGKWVNDLQFSQVINVQVGETDTT